MYAIRSYYEVQTNVGNEDRSFRFVPTRVDYQEITHVYHLGKYGLRKGFRFDDIDSIDTWSYNFV